MNPVAFHFAGGDAFFSGTTLMLLACAAAAWQRTADWSRTIRVLALAGATTAALSATPLPLWYYGVWGAIFFGWFVSSSLALRRRTTRTAFTITAFAINVLTVVFCLIGIVWEISFRVALPSPPTTFSTLAVIGDSISAGMSAAQEQTWPESLRDTYGVEVDNVSQPGATARSAVGQAAAIRRDDTLVLIEIGGNDLLAGLPARQFARDLERLLHAVRHPGRQLVMLELPLPPLYNGYGRVQRDLARRFDVILIPRRQFARVLVAEGATLDGLHLSSKGHELMAEMIWRHVGPWLQAERQV